MPDVGAGVHVGSGSRIRRRTVVVGPREGRDHLVLGREVIRLSVIEGDRFLTDRPRSARAGERVVRRQAAVCAVAVDRHAVHAVGSDRATYDAYVGGGKVVRDRAVAKIEGNRRIKPGDGIGEGDGLGTDDAVDRKRSALRRTVVGEGVAFGPSCGKRLGRDRPSLACRCGQRVIGVGERGRRRRIIVRIGFSRRRAAVSDRANVALHNAGEGRHRRSVRLSVVGNGRIGPGQTDGLLRDDPSMAREGTFVIQYVVVRIRAGETVHYHTVSSDVGNVRRRQIVEEADHVARNEALVAAYAGDRSRGHRTALVVNVGVGVAADRGVIPAVNVELTLIDLVGVTHTGDSALYRITSGRTALVLLLEVDPVQAAILSSVGNVISEVRMIVRQGIAVDLRVIRAVVEAAIDLDHDLRLRYAARQRDVDALLVRQGIPVVDH